MNTFSYKTKQFWLFLQTHKLFIWNMKRYAYYNFDDKSNIVLYFGAKDKALIVIHLRLIFLIEFFHLRRCKNHFEQKYSNGVLMLICLRVSVSLNLNCFIERLHTVHIPVRQICCISFDLIRFK